MKIQNMITTSLLLAMGFVLHSIVPAIFGMKFDLMLTFMFIAIILQPTFKNTLLTGLLTGILTAMTTTFPGGQLPNLIEKIITALIVYGLIIMMQKIKSNNLKATVIGCVGTLFSGMLFLSIALVIVGLPAPLSVLVMSIVIPTAVTNGFLTLIVYRASLVATRGKVTL